MRSISHLLNFPKQRLLVSRDLNLLFYERVIRDLVNKLVFFFFPIYLFQLGSRLIPEKFNLTQWQAGMITLAGFFIVSKLLIMLLAIPVGKITSKIGYQRSLVYSYIFRLLSFLFLFLSVISPVLLLASIFMEALQVVLYWPAYHTLLAKNSPKRTIGTSLGTLQFILLLVGAIMPAISGILNAQIGFQFIFILGLMGLALNLCIVLLISDSCDMDKVSFQEFRAWLGEKRYERFSLAIIGRYFYDIMLFIWPFYLFILFGTVERVGFFATIALFLALIVTVVSTFNLDYQKNRLPFKITGISIAFTWLLRTQITSFWGLALADTLDKVSGNYHWLYFDTIWYKRGKGNQAHSFFVYHELLQALAMAVFWLVVLVVMLKTSSFNALFILSALGVVATLLIKEK